MTENRVRSLTKALSYRLVSSAVTGSIFFAAIRNGRLALSVALFDSIVKVIVFYLHERAWTQIKFPRDNYSPIEVEGGSA